MSPLAKVAMKAAIFQDKNLISAPTFCGETRLLFANATGYCFINQKRG